MVRIRTPNPEYSGTQYGVLFRNGIAVIETPSDAMLEFFERCGYSIERVDSGANAPTPEPKPVETITEQPRSRGRGRPRR
jgi:hypothetical protein